MNWKFIGYFPKHRASRSSWVSPFPDYPDAEFPVASPVEEICSVSDCIAKGPNKWREQAKHNFYDLYDSPALAWSIVPIEIRIDFEMFAYRLHMVEFVDGQEYPIEERETLAVEPMSDAFVRLGFDAVEGGNHHGFGCSPLSCNNQAGQHGMPGVNRYCLVETLEAGIDLAREFSLSKPEPGPYCVVEVWRDNSAPKP